MSSPYSSVERSFCCFVSSYDEKHLQEKKAARYQDWTNVWKPGSFVDREGRISPAPVLWATSNQVDIGDPAGTRNNGDRGSLAAFVLCYCCRHVGITELFRPFYLGLVEVSTFPLIFPSLLPSLHASLAPFLSRSLPLFLPPFFPLSLFFFPSVRGSHSRYYITYSCCYHLLRPFSFFSPPKLHLFIYFPVQHQWKWKNCLWICFYWVHMFLVG